MLTFHSVSFSYPTSVSDKALLSNVSFSVSAGQRVCLVGPNGVGKSTVLALARGDLEPDSGSITRPRSLGVPHGCEDAHTLGDVLECYIRPVRDIESEFSALTVRLGEHPEDPGLISRYDELLALMESMQVWELDTRRDEALTELGLGSIPMDRPIGQMSPGQLARTHLAGVLLSRPVVLILDEPTNHLDDAGTEFLVKTLNSWPGPVLFTSHDRSFIERTATALVDLDTAPWQALSTAAGNPEELGCYVCAGSYSDFRRQKRAAQLRHSELHAQQQALSKSLAAHIKDSEVVGHKDFSLRSESKISKKFYADRNQRAVTRRTSDDQRRLDQLGRVEVRRPRCEEQIPVFPAPNPTVGTILVSTSAGVDRTLDGRPVAALATREFELSAGEQLLLIGPNGCGKSTFLSWLAHSGACLAPYAYLPQRLPEKELPSILDCLRSADASQEVAQGFLHPRLWSQPIHTLSDGNQRRAQLALTFAGLAGLVEGRPVKNPVTPEILLIDEPTNYLDLDFIEAFEEGLRGFAGAVVLASHDQWLIDSWTGPIFNFNDIT